MVRIHPHLTVLIVVGVVMRVVTMVAFQPALLLHADAYGYLRVADDLEPSPPRPSLYPLLLRLVYPFHSLLPVVVLQHIAGLAMAIGIYALLKRLGVGPFGSAVGSAPLFLDAYQLNIEHYVLSETLFQVLILGALFLIAAPRTPSPRAVVVAGFLLGLSGITRVAGVVLMGPVLLYLLWKRVGLKPIAACVGAFLIPVLSYATWFYLVWGDFALTSRGSLIFYGRVSPFADCRNESLPEYERVLCDVRPPSERPGTEFYVWRILHPLSPLRDFEPPPGMELDEVLSDFSRRIVIAQPLDYARVVGGDLLHYIAPGRWEGERDSQQEQWEFADTPDFGPDDAATLNALKATGDNLPKVIRDYRGSPEPTGLWGDEPPPEFEIVGPFARFLDGYQDIVYTHGPLVGLAALLGCVGVVLRPTSGRRRSVRPEAFLFTATGLALLFVPAATAVFDYRYLLPAMPLLSIAGVLGAHTIEQRRRPPGRHLKL
jgi:hypothetical protein